MQFSPLMIICFAGIVICLAAQVLTRGIQNSFVIRLISGLILVFAAIPVVNYGGLLMLLVSLFLSCTALLELFRATGVHAQQGGITAMEIVGFGGTALYYLYLAGTTVYPDLFGGIFQRTGALVIPVLCFAAFLIVYVLRWPAYTHEQVMAAYFSFIYASVLLSYVFLSRMMGGESDPRFGIWMVILIFLSSWGSDTCAYCVGMLIGKHKMTPKLSPKKTIEGGIGGVVGAMLLAYVLSVVIGPVFSARIHPGLMAVICGIGALISMAGDLAASAIKRETSIKDYGKLIPGHGGVMDRFDSVILVAPVIYYAAMLLA